MCVRVRVRVHGPRARTDAEPCVPILHLAVLALLQGITEFLPISSSAHLILLPVVMDWPDQGRVLDVAVHVGTLLAVMVYAWRDIGTMLSGLFRMLKGRGSPGLRLFGQLVLATIPVVVAGYLVARYAGDALRDPRIIAWTTIGFALLLWVADRIGMTLNRIEHLGFGGAFFIGMAQVLALLPGTSRAGITMTAARFLGMERAESARFSLLLAIPAILGAGALETLSLVEAGDIALGKDAAIAVGLSFVAALIAIAVMMAWLKRASFLPFILYRLALGGGLIAWLYF